MSGPALFRTPLLAMWRHVSRRSSFDESPPTGREWIERQGGAWIWEREGRGEGPGTLWPLTEEAEKGEWVE